MAAVIDWTAYNEGQVQELALFDALLRGLLEGVAEPEQVMGRPRLPLRDALFCAVQKVYSQLSSRRAHGLYENAVGRQHLARAPHFNAPSKVLNRADVTPILHALIEQSAVPLASLENDFAVDSTGFRTTSFNAYCQEKHGARKENVWLKAHLMVGVRTHVVAQVRVTDGRGKGTGDTTHFASLVRGATEAGFTLREVSADKAYSSRQNLVLTQELGGVAYIPFRSNASGLSRGAGAAWHRIFHYFQLHRDEFNAHYHKRSNVESAIGAMKRKLGETLKSKNRVAQENELLCKVLAYNITVLIHEMHERGVDPGFIGVRCST